MPNGTPIQLQPKQVKPQPGFQEEFLRSSADIVIGGGAAFAGKTFALLMEAARHVANPGYGGIIFRRTTVQIRNEGGLWDTSRDLYAGMRGTPRDHFLDWSFPSGAAISFNHLQYENDVLQYQGAQICFIGWDEVTHFTARQFWYMLSRNRSLCGVKPYVRATCNPDPDSFIAELIEWYIEQEENLPDGSPNPRYGFPIPERAGVLRYFIRADDQLIWGNSVEEVVEQAPHIFNDPKYAGLDVSDLVKSFTFIPGTIKDNKIGMSKDPGYMGNLLSQDEVTQLQLKDGNWKVRIDALAMVNPVAIHDMFTNQGCAGDQGYITCDAARYGRDYCTIWVWKGWEVQWLAVQLISDPHSIVKEIEALRTKWSIPKSRVLIDQDGVGGDTVQLGGYQGFAGGAPALDDPITKEKELYFNLKTQCYYRFCNRINDAKVSLRGLNNGTVTIDGVHGMQIKRGTKLFTVADLTKEDLRSLKRRNQDGDGKKQMITKEEQKAALRRSPDFSDGLMMREWFELHVVVATTVRVKF